MTLPCSQTLFNSNPKPEIEELSLPISTLWSSQEAQKTQKGIGKMELPSYNL
jgi:hypothetical protein